MGAVDTDTRTLCFFWRDFQGFDFVKTSSIQNPIIKHSKNLSPLFRVQNTIKNSCLCKLLSRLNSQACCRSEKRRFDCTIVQKSEMDAEHVCLCIFPVVKHRRFFNTFYIFHVYSFALALLALCVLEQGTWLYLLSASEGTLSCQSHVHVFLTFIQCAHYLKNITGYSKRAGDHPGTVDYASKTHSSTLDSRVKICTACLYAAR